jgi:hypothetical protein
MGYMDRSINEMQLLYLSFCIPTRILNDEGMSFLTSSDEALYPLGDNASVGRRSVMTNDCVALFLIYSI